MVFRPASFPFPLSRGRRSISLKKDGTLVEGGPGPTDRTRSTKGKWSVEGRTLTLKRAGEADRVYEIASSEADRLVLTGKPGA